MTALPRQGPRLDPVDRDAAADRYPPRRGRRGPAPCKADRDASIVAAYVAGMTIREIARDAAISDGISANRVNIILRRRGVPMRPARARPKGERPC